MKRILHCLTCLVMTCFLSHCALYGKPEVPSLNNPNHFKTKIKISHAKIKDHWWENFHDAKLNHLVCLAIRNNYNYQISIKNIEIACTYVYQNLSNLFPQVSLNFNSSRNKSSSAALNGYGGANVLTPNSSHFARIFNLQQLNGTVTYQLDVWNQIRNSVKQAEANQSVSEADSRNVKLSVINSVVTTYFQIKALQSNLINLHKQVHIAKEIVKLDNAQFRGGLIDYSTLDDAKNQVELINTNIASLEKQKHILEFTLAYLCGEYPENFNMKIGNGFNLFRQINLIPSGIPANMIANRPDIQDAYYQILSYGYLQKQNIANFLPSINLTGGYGYANSALSNLIKSSHSYWNYGLFATQYVFDYQMRMSEYNRSTYQYESAILNYKNTVINAFKEVDSNLSSYKGDNESLRAYQKQYFITKDKLMLADSQYQAGLTDYSTYLTTDLSYLQTDYNLTNQKLAVLEDIAQVYVSLGIGA